MIQAAFTSASPALPRVPHHVTNPATNPMRKFSPQPQPEACAAPCPDVLRPAAPEPHQPSRRIFVGCVFTTLIISQRAHPKNRQVPSQTIGVHLQSSQTSCFTRFCTPLTPAAPAPTRRAIPRPRFFFFAAPAAGVSKGVGSFATSRASSVSPTSASRSVARLSLPHCSLHDPELPSLDSSRPLSFALEAFLTIR
ncbi:hypothetical protein TgHK011_006335 [Trichoderma gracile]|nr:hypothetical protein TgHK011_006335 [Trichoderma gracile]